MVNVGQRQKGRLAPDNVITTGNAADEILHGIRRATTAPFRRKLTGKTNPYGDGTAAPRILEVLSGMNLADPRLIHKPFHELTQSQSLPMTVV